MTSNPDKLGVRRLFFRGEICCEVAVIVSPGLRVECTPFAANNLDDNEELGELTSKLRPNCFCRQLRSSL